MNKTIMIVDDDIMNIKIAKCIFEENKYNVIEANSGMACLNILRSKNRPNVDMILLDISMPVLDGFKTMEVLRNDDELNQIPVMFLTASSEECDVKMAVKLGAASYIKKPFMPNELLKRVHSIIGYAD